MPRNGESSRNPLISMVCIWSTIGEERLTGDAPMVGRAKVGGPEPQKKKVRNHMVLGP